VPKPRPAAKANPNKELHLSARSVDLVVDFDPE
jgi:hypothetical protein